MGATAAHTSCWMTVVLLHSFLMRVFLTARNDGVVCGQRKMHHLALFGHIHFNREPDVNKKWADPHLNVCATFCGNLYDPVSALKLCGRTNARWPIVSKMANFLVD